MGAREYVVVHEYEWCTSGARVVHERCTRGARDYVVVQEYEWFARLRSGEQDYVVVHE